MASAAITSHAGLIFIRRWEGCSLTVYQDAAGYDTIGVGHLIVDGDPPSFHTRGVTEDEALEILAEDVAHAEHCVRSYVEWPLRQCQFDALVSFTFNVGGSALRRSTLRRVLNQGKEGWVGRELIRWNRAGGVVSEGLSRRREAESALFNLGDYGSGP